MKETRQSFVPWLKSAPQTEIASLAGCQASDLLSVAVVKMAVWAVAHYLELEEE